VWTGTRAPQRKWTEQRVGVLLEAPRQDPSFQHGSLSEVIARGAILASFRCATLIQRCLPRAL
jgi:hypothetical protein